MFSARSRSPRTGARGAERAGRPGVDEWIEARLKFPNGPGGFSLSSVVHNDFSMMLRLAGSVGEIVADDVQPHKDAGLHVSVPAGARSSSSAPIVLTVPAGGLACGAISGTGPSCRSTSTTQPRLPK